MAARPYKTRAAAAPCAPTRQSKKASKYFTTGQQCRGRVAAHLPACAANDVFYLRAAINLVVKPDSHLFIIREIKSIETQEIDDDMRAYRQRLGCRYQNAREAPMPQQMEVIK